MKRIAERGRVGENAITIEYMTTLQEQYKLYLDNIAAEKIVKKVHFNDPDLSSELLQLIRDQIWAFQRRRYSQPKATLP